MWKRSAAQVTCILLFAPLLSGCGSKISWTPAEPPKPATVVVEKTVLVNRYPPDDLIRAEPLPAPLTEAEEKDPKAVGRYIIDLETTMGSYHFRMAAIRDLKTKDMARAPSGDGK